jgi:hypothetical protein
VEVPVPNSRDQKLFPSVLGEVPGSELDFESRHRHDKAPVNLSVNRGFPHRPKRCRRYDQFLVDAIWWQCNPLSPQQQERSQFPAVARLLKLLFAVA